MHEVLEKYPLPESEQRALVWAALASEGMILAGGVIAAIVLSVARGTPHALPFGWLADIAASMSPHWMMVVLPLAMLALLESVDILGMRYSESYRASNREIRQDVTGELPRLPFGWICICMTAAGLCEELLFRYGLLGLVVWALGLVMPFLPAAVLATVLVSLAFRAVHIQYRNAWTAALVIGISCLLCGVYLVTGSLLCVMFAHAVYNIVELMVERRKMLRDPDYFGGYIPVDAAQRMLRQPAGRLEEPEQAGEEDARPDGSRAMETAGSSDLEDEREYDCRD